MGVEKWIELQLHPEKINNSALDARLEQYATLRMTAHEMTLNFPSPQLLKEVQDGKLPMPSDPYRHAIYSANLMRLEDKQEAKQNAASLTTVAANNSSPMMASAESNQKAKADRSDIPESELRQRRELVAQLTLLDPATRMRRILALSPEQQEGIFHGIGEPGRQPVLAGLTPEQRETVLAMNNPAAVVYDELQSAKLLRAVYSNRQLEEVLTDFWFNHFNVYLTKGADHYLVTSYERDVIRPHVLGKFKDLLLATAQSPAMLVFLDNWQSVGPDSDEALGIKEHAAQNPRVRWRNTPLGHVL